MPTKEQMDAIVREIEELIVERSFSPLDGGRVVVTPHGRGTDDGFFYWGELPERDKLRVMAGIDWEGFTEAQRDDVIRRVIDGQDAGSWMDGIEPDSAAKARVERRLREIKAEPEIYLESTLRYVQPDPEDMDSVYDTCDTLGPWDSLKASEKLRVLEGEFDWSGVGDRQKEMVLAREVDFGKITRDQLDDVFGAIPADVDERPARRLFDEANFERAAADRSGYDEQLATARETTRNLIESVRADEWPRAGAITDFGLVSQEHYEALYYAIRNDEIGPAVLDAALGYGEKLTELARDAPGNPHKGIRFHTAWDELLGRGGPESAGPRVGGAQASLTAAILADPHGFLPDPAPGNDHGHENGPGRGR